MTGSAKIVNGNDASRPAATADEKSIAGDTTSDAAGRRAWQGRVSPLLPPTFALLEMSILAALVLAEYFWDSFPNLTRMNPHPYWIAVLLLSLQYGTVSGLMAAGIAIIGTVLIGMPEPDIEERYFNYLIRVWTQPVLWLLVAMLLGTFRTRQIEQRDELRQSNENLRLRGATLLDHTANLSARCAMLERRIAVRETADTGKLLASLARLGEAEPGRWSAALDDALAAGFPKSQFSVYVVDGGQARLVLTHQRASGQSPPVQPQSELPADHPLMIAVVGRSRPVSVVEPADDEALRGSGMAAVPIFAATGDAGDKRIIGILKADLLPPSQIDASTTRRLSVVAAFLAPVLQRGLILPVGNPSGGDESVPTVRKWRLLKWLPGGRSGASSVAENNDG